MKNRKEDIIFIAVLLVLILIFVVFKVVKGNKAEAPAPEIVPTTTTLSNGEMTPKIVVLKKKKTDTVWPELSYSEELNKYRDGRLVQFNANCAVFPATMAIANGSDIMLDNRSKVTQTITIGNNKHVLDPYDFEILKISVPQIPVTYLFDCNDRENVATLIVE
ncbi:MAG: hypothetical protein WCO07_01715 [bacterium]